MDYLATTSNELSDQEIDQIVELFYLCFDKRITPSELKYKYATPHFGFSYVGMMKDEHKIIRGAFAIQPYKFRVHNTIKIFGSVVDVMVDENYRSNLLAFSSMYKKVIEKMNGKVLFLYAVPNINSYLYFIKFLRWQPIGKLSYYILPLNLNKFINVPTFINSLLKNFIIFFQKNLPGFRNIEENKLITKVANDSYKEYRFNAQNKYKKIIINSSLVGWYRIFVEDKKKIVYLIDFINVSNHDIAKSVRKVLSVEKSDFDAIMYIGNLSFNSWPLLKVPFKFEPRKLELIGYKIDAKLDDHLVYDIVNWQFNLADIDVR